MEARSASSDTVLAPLKKEYIRTLQSKQKWNQPVRNLQENNIALLLDETWKMGRIGNVYPNS